jgi:hypothetical protein
MTKLLVQNSKISNSSNGKFLVFNFGIPAYQSATGLKTCPMAGICADGCYATQGAYTWSNVAQAYEYRLAESLKSEFVDVMSVLIDRKIAIATRKGKQLAIRIHDSGDFYSIKYVKRWLAIIAKFPQVQFYAYTKQVALFTAMQARGIISSNFTLIYSEGGKLDNKIDTDSMRHSRVFSSIRELFDAGYDDATSNDTVAFTSLTGKIGLVYHGAKSKQWTTAA